MSQARPFFPRSLIPSSAQRLHAIATLNPLQTNLDYQKILNWHALTRSAFRKAVEEIEEQGYIPSPSENDFTAILTLVHCREDYLHELLRQDQSLRKYLISVYL